MALQPGTVFADYTIERMLGRGGMGVVYLARQPRLQRNIALKVLDVDPSSDPEARAAFNREAALAASLEHPNIVAVLDRSGPDDPALWLAIRYITGGDAAALLAAAPDGLAPQRAVRFVTDCAHALDFAHEHNVLHRDVKPANLLIDNDPRHGERAVLTDFGIARALDGRSTETAVSATFAYVAPERFTSQPTDHRADQYSLGCTLYHLLTGQYPFPYPDEAAIISAHLNAPPPAPSKRRPDLPAALDDVVATAMAKKPDRRYPTCIDLATAAAAALDGLETRTAPTRKPAPPPGRSAPVLSRRRVLIGGAITVPVAGAAALGLTSAFTAPRARPRIENSILNDHVAIVGSVTCSPDGTLIASASYDNTVKLWPVGSETPAVTLEGHDAQVSSVRFHPGGTMLASASEDKTVRLWDVRTGKPVGDAIRDHKAEAWSAAFNQDGGLLASGGADRAVRIRNIRTGAARDPLYGHTDEVYAVAFSPDGTVLASGSKDHSVRLWNPNTNAFMRSFDRHEGQVWSIAFSPDGRFLAAGTDSPVVRIWDIRTGEPRTFSTESGYPGYAVAFSRDGTRLAVGCDKGAIQLWDLQKNHSLGQPLRGHEGGVRSVAFGPDDAFLVSGGEDAGVRLWAL